MKPLVSTIIPVFNTERYLNESIESALRQEVCGEHEVIIVDDGSTDNSVNIARRFLPRIKLIKQTHAGQAAARNLGIEAAQGDYIAFLDADDRWPPGRLAILLSAFEKEPELDMVFGHAQQFLSSELTEEERRNFRIPSTPQPGYSPGAMVSQRRTFLCCGNFSTEVRIGEFIDWFNRAREAGFTHALVPEVVLERRIHAENTTLRLKAMKRDYLAVVKAALDRRRAAASEADRNN